MSERQRQIRLDIFSNVRMSIKKRRELKTERSRILKRMRQRVKTLRSEEIREKVEYLNTLKDCAKQFEAIKMISGSQLRKTAKLIVHDDKGKNICDDQEAATFVRTHFESLFSCRSMQPIPAFENQAKPLDNPISSGEVFEAIKKLKNGKACGLDGIAAELLKAGPPELADLLANVINRSLSYNEELELGLGLLITL